MYICIYIYIYISSEVKNMSLFRGEHYLIYSISEQKKSLAATFPCIWGLHCPGLPRRGGPSPPPALGPGVRDPAARKYCHRPF